MKLGLREHVILLKDRRGVVSTGKEPSWLIRGQFIRKAGWGLDAPRRGGIRVILYCGEQRSTVERNVGIQFRQK